MDLAVSLGSGTPFLGRFPVPRRVRVAVFCGEFAPAAVAETARRIITAKGKLPKNCRVRLCGELPAISRVASRADLRKLLTENEIGVVVIDPLYLCLVAGNPTLPTLKLVEVGEVLAKTTACCLAAGATPVFVHHTTKRSAAKASAPSLTDLMFAGVPEFARQWVLLSRRTEFQPGSGSHDLVMAVGGSLGHASQWRVRITESRVGKRTWKVAIEAAAADHLPPAVEKGNWGFDVAENARANSRHMNCPVSTVGGMRRATIGCETEVTSGLSRRTPTRGSDVAKSATGTERGGGAKAIGGNRSRDT